VSLAETIRDLEERWERYSNPAEDFPRQPVVFCNADGTACSLKSATQEEIDTYYIAERQAALKPRGGPGRKKEFFAVRPIIRICFVKAKEAAGA
jgi:hypothetical protein